MKSIGFPLHILFNKPKPIQTGIVPDSMKIANVIPIYKAKEQDNFSNYRPMSLLTSMLKITEQIFINETNKISYENQFGFRRKHSTIECCNNKICH